MAKVPLRVYNREIETMIDRGQLDEAIAHCHHIFKTFPKHLETYRLLGKAYLEYKRYREAVDVFSRVLVAEPNDFVANVGMSIIRDEENKLDDAIWHMERAFETQPSNAAIQGELQRLYGRRDGVQPPRIRMTRGALAHMYVQGELYPQAISEIKSVLKEDPGRSDMEALLARACYRSGLKNEAADAASKVLRRYPYCLDANRVLREIFGTDKSESAQIYRQRVVELDPYAAHVTGTVFQSNEVSDAAVSLEHLDWNGQPVSTGAQADWSTNQAIGLESGTKGDEQPEWLRSAYADTLPPTTPSPTRPVDQVIGGSVPAFEPSAKPNSEDEIPEFLRAAGWGQSTGAFDESKPIFGTEEPAAAQPIEQGDIPDWVKAMAPTEAVEPAPAEEEELPDWINKIGTSSLPVPNTSDSDQVDWMSQLGQTADAESPAQSTSDDLDWMSQLGEASESMTGETPSTEQPDWIRQLDQPDSSMSGSGEESEGMTQPDQPAAAEPASAEQPEWIQQLDEPEPPISMPGSDELPEWMKQSDFLSPSTPAEEGSDEQPDWLKQAAEPAPAAPASDLPDWLKPSEELAQADSTEPATQEQPDWMRPLDLTAPMEPGSEHEMEGPQQPDQPFEAVQDTPAQELSGEFDSVSRAASQTMDQPEEAASQPEIAAPAIPPALDVDKLGVSEQERDDSFAWLESLAAKQGASEGLLTKPEDRLEEEPDWIRQAKGLQGLNADRVSAEDSSAGLESDTSFSSDVAEPTPVPTELPAMEEVSPVEPTLPQPSDVGELGKSEQERDDSFAWLESLAAKQGASEGLLTRPEERLEEEPDWVKQAREVSSTTFVEQRPVETPAMEEVPPTNETPPTPEPAVHLEELGKSDQERDDSFAWLESLAAKQGASEGLLTNPEDRLEEEPDWVKQAKDLDATSSIQAPVQDEPVPEPASETPALEDTAAWLHNLDEEEAEASDVSSRARDETGIWLKSLVEEESAPEPDSTRASDETGMWLRNLDEESRQTPDSTPTGDETAMWLKSLSEEEAKPVPASESDNDETAMWLKSLDEAEKVSAEAETEEHPDLPAWMQHIDQGVAPDVAAPPPENPVPDTPSWLNEADEPEPPSFISEQASPKPETGSLPSWLRGLENPEQETASSAQDELPAWLRDETSEPSAEPAEVEPTRASDWQPAETGEPEPQPLVEQFVEAQQVELSDVQMQAPEPEPEPVERVEETPSPVEQAVQVPEPEPVSVPPPAPYQEPVTRKATGRLTMPTVDSVLGSARNELSRSNIPGALDSYAKLIRKGRFLDEIIYDLRDALYRFPVEVSIWQSLGDAYMRANRLQDALDAYTKAEELLR